MLLENKCKVSATDQPHTLLGSIFNFTFTFQNSSLNSLLLQITSELHFWTFQAQNTENTDWSRYEHWVVSCKLKTLMMKSQLEWDWSETGGTKQTTPRNRNKSETMRETGLNVWSELLEWSSASGRRSQCQLTSDTQWPAPLRPLAPVADTHQTGTRDNTNPGLYYMSLNLIKFQNPSMI